MAYVRVDVENVPDEFVNLEHVTRIAPRDAGTSWRVDLHFAPSTSPVEVTGFASQAAAEAYALNLAESVGLVTVD